MSKTGTMTSLAMKQAVAAAEKSLQLVKEIIFIENEVNAIRSMASDVGFVEVYFAELPSSQSQQEAFMKTNSKYFRLFGVSKFESFQQFKSQLWKA